MSSITPDALAFFFFSVFIVDVIVSDIIAKKKKIAPGRSVAGGGIGEMGRAEVVGRSLGNCWLFN